MPARFRPGTRGAAIDGLESRPPQSHADREAMNTEYRKALPGTSLDYFDARAAVDAIAPGAYDRLPFTSRVLAVKQVSCCEAAALN